MKGVPMPASQMPLAIDKQAEVNGIGMGVLSDGTPFLNGRGLARLCGVHHKVIQDIAANWDTNKPAIARIQEILGTHGLYYKHPYTAVTDSSGAFNAYPDGVCLAILEYYAFDAGQNRKEEALMNFRLLAGKALRDFIYAQVGYDPDNHVPSQWKQFHDRMSLVYNAAPAGYFGIFKEIADMIVHLGQNGIHIDSTFVPDGSVGIHWAKHWKDNNLEATFGPRQKYDHNYPDYFPQALSNPQESNCYPESALGEFRRWFREVYIGAGKFETYLTGKVKDKSLPVSFAQLAVASYKDPQKLQ
ncbi:TPA: hypothetical protein L5Q18_003242 [Pseudomonas aeruginosa]|uniref:hypothetical protein n=1 Tax=Pseudomonas aeruginosa TaxID=287 RepID=UPI001068B0BC|nr:hypothetical protein [Pseudomonas aeruginosa]MBV6277945.1 hypothetical protein [Pseudomonas aeruginosa]TEC25986.1 hypothetical protein IPC1599_00965 [Pseudomonas aeruginosa]HBP0649241.1 hypothetical protein [Pseudomonas aeruginosa]HEJ1856743.1 hypothetical protein [Pseudomonas aeruginosa]